MTEAIKAYIEKRLSGLDKILSNFPTPQDAHVEVGKTTNHHKKGDIFRCEVNLHLLGKVLRAECESNNLYTAIDLSKDDLARQINSFKEKMINQKRRPSGQE